MKIQDIAQTLEDFEFSYRQNVRYLNNASVVIGDTELFFTTLWTRIDPFYLYTVQRGMNDFRYGVLNGERFCANDVDGLHQRCLQWLQGALKASGADYWIYGHTHFPGGSGETIGRTRLLCNQLGYVFSNEHTAFRKDAVIEL